MMEGRDTVSLVSWAGDKCVKRGHLHCVCVCLCVGTAHIRETEERLLRGSCVVVVASVLLLLLLLWLLKWWHSVLVKRVKKKFL